MTKDQAKRLGYSFYNTGVACNRGHMSDRYMSNGACIECQKLKQQKPKTTKPTRSAAKQKGLKKYLSDKLCKNGHTGYRFTATDVCCWCFGEYKLALSTLKHYPNSIDAIKARETVKNYETSRSY